MSAMTQRRSGERFEPVIQVRLTRRRARASRAISSTKISHTTSTLRYLYAYIYDACMHAYSVHIHTHTCVCERERERERERESGREGERKSMCVCVTYVCNICTIHEHILRLHRDNLRGYIFSCSLRAGFVTDYSGLSSWL